MRGVLASPARMSEPIPESIPTSQDPRSKRPTKRLALTPTGQQATQLNALFANPDREIQVPNATGKPRGVAPPPEIVANVQGSSAGAGSGEFHVYKASRRKEYERLRLMDEEVKKEKEVEQFERDREQKKAKDEAKTSKNKARRDKVKERKAKAKEKEKVRENGKDDGEAGKMEIERDAAGTKPSRGINGASEEGGKNGTVEESANPDEIGLVIHDED